MKDGCNELEACKREGSRYLQAIGVLDASGNGNGTAERGTSSAWKATHGFSPKPWQPYPGELRAVYWNDGDLGLARDMHCRFNSATWEVAPDRFAARWTRACYVTNYAVYYGEDFVGTPDIARSIELAANANAEAIATVAMEVSVNATYGADFYEEYPEDVKFIAFNEKQDGRAWVDPPLDSEPAKALPGTCIACHGGRYIGSQNPGGSRVVGANFLPFDVGGFKFTTDPNLSSYSESSQREAIRALNAFVKDARPAAATVGDLIDGWYAWCGGVSAPGCYPLSRAYLPSGVCIDNAEARRSQSCGWDTGQPRSSHIKPAHLAESVYYNVSAKYCRTCHVALPEKQNTENFSAWNPGTQAAVNNLRMPFAELPYKRYMNDRLAQNQFNAFFSDRASDCVNVCKECRQGCVAAQRECIANGDSITQCGGHWQRCLRQCAEKACIDACPY